MVLNKGFGDRFKVRFEPQSISFADGTTLGDAGAPTEAN